MDDSRHAQRNLQLTLHFPLSASVSYASLPPSVTHNSQTYAKNTQNHTRRTLYLVQTQGYKEQVGLHLSVKSLWRCLSRNNSECFNSYSIVPRLSTTYMLLSSQHFRWLPHRRILGFQSTVARAVQFCHLPFILHDQTISAGFLQHALQNEINVNSTIEHAEETQLKWLSQQHFIPTVTQHRNM